jgi:hypothetical protein
MAIKVARGRVSATSAKGASSGKMLPSRCPYWADGAHCYVPREGFQGTQGYVPPVKVCACGATVAAATP